MARKKRYAEFSHGSLSGSENCAVRKSMKERSRAEVHAEAVEPVKKH